MMNNEAYVFWKNFSKKKYIRKIIHPLSFKHFDHDCIILISISKIKPTLEEKIVQTEFRFYSSIPRHNLRIFNLRNETKRQQMKSRRNWK